MLASKSVLCELSQTEDDSWDSIANGPMYE